MALETEVNLNNLDEFGLGSNQLIVSKGMSICRDFLISKLSDYIGGTDSKFIINENDLDMGFTSDDLSTTITSDMIKDLKKQIINQQNFIQNKIKNKSNNNNNNNSIIQFFIKYMVNSFYSGDSNTLKGLLYEVLNFRNMWAHQRPFSVDDANRLLDTLERLFITLGDCKMASMMQTLKHTHYFYSFNKIYGLLSLDKNSSGKKFSNSSS
ncbi:hypothetical protein DICPUDRAFT_97960 [Dictyostelium purpureum]|uniref:Swt1-like HEPN domain-containing protein n=1 Tax=Dictyostelium purpureum TaxID=5786 RepID=F0ZLE5_DICPU|nr:uncharacterized protein DICPUDRAFT_97960 [Dictyostelium purpureum]EGC35253.1 hypothetical protein DICPUDRAFT_97960 [Dictyostelium purpureum]|eukprot:XP_003288240.1 hypothetical protein DICPUDRAFT_97960 [Dictyostelium purpureum]